MPTKPRQRRDEQRRTAVVKTLWPPQPETLKLHRQYGSALVCVRYRRDVTGLYRHTTVELVVEEAPSEASR